MSFWEEIAKALGGDVQYTYPSSGNSLARSSLAQFAPSMSVASMLPADPNPPEKSPLMSFAQQPDIQQPQMQPQSQIQEPYNRLERAFLGFGGQGEAVKADKQRYQLAKLAEAVPADPNDKVGTALQQYAMQNPDGAESYLKYAMTRQGATKPETTGLPEGQMWSKDAQGNFIAVPIPGAKVVEKPYSEIAKLKADLDAGRIDKATYDRKIAKEVAPTEKNYKQFQLQNAGFADRMVNATGILSPFEEKIQTDQFDPINKKAVTLAGIPSFGIGSAAGNAILSDEQQSYKNAAQEWIRAKLRKESGAAIGVKEMEDEYTTYFPRVGDSKSTINQKAQLRKIATDSMQKQTGGAYDDMYGNNTPDVASAASAKPKYSEGQQARWPDGSIKTFRGGKWQ